MTDWSRLRHAYGTAEDVPVLLARVGTGPEEEVWGDLWSRLCHQGSVYPASFAALPELADLGGRKDEDGDNALVLAGAIVAAADEGERRDHAGSVERLRALAGDRVRRPAEPALYVNLLQALMAFDGDRVWSYALEGLIDEVYEVFCPACDMGVFVSIGEAGHFSAVGDHEPGDPGATPLRPAAPAELSGPARVLYDSAVAARMDPVAVGLTHLFGTGTCGECGAEFPVAAQVADVH
ncbi:hypothetical protein [Actinacidiphila sp. bgisy160]|uniref:hypothetical protein n=1 Tax=Actinacidiphila sp. bgisy160 TaxID=3413796 RepID=UPI003D74E778